MRREDWLLAQLPVGMLQDDFFVRFLSIFQEVGGTLADGVDNLENVLDATVTPVPLVRHLASWIGVPALDDSLPEDLQRRILRTSARMLAWRGTARGLRDFLEMVSGGPAEVEDGGGVYPEGAAPAEPPLVRLRVASTGWLPQEDFVALVRAELPAHARAELWVGGERVWPADPAVLVPAQGQGVRV